MSPLRLVPRPGLLPVGAAVLLGALALVEAWTDPTFRPSFTALAWVAVWIAGSLASQTRWPAAGAVAVAASFPLGEVLGAPGPGGAGLIAVLVAVAWAGYAATPRRSRLAVAACILTFVVTDVVRAGISWDSIFFPAIFVPAWWTGTLVRREQARAREIASLAAQLDAQREAAAHAAVVEERARIAREVHDSVAHSLSVMTLQLGGLRRQLGPLLDDRPAERDVMLGLERLGRQSVEELRATVGILRTPRDGEADLSPVSLSRAGDLVADVRAAGLDVALETHGDLTTVPRAVDVAAYRVAQEALSNVLRHAPGARTVLRLRHEHDAVEVAVRDDGPRRVDGAASASTDTHDDSTARATGGHGLVGMRERTGMFGGTLAAGPVAGGGFEVRARFPIGRGWQ
ncbi:sensor histidine kinase [Intrasporangium sp. YIM S08009]|uniref:sensor histidine kinase n=1 Tax=Intrasporangium zincisolvens TaxID=3080018 RepID=UPI002B05DB2D|nr:histidine kinase [Intrasporangium sp. YIM S08009]